MTNNTKKFEKYIEFLLKDAVAGGFQPHFVFLSEDTSNFMPITWKDEQQKSVTLEYLKMFCVAHEIDEYFVVCECWTADGKHADYIKGKSAGEQPEHIRRDTFTFMHVAKDYVRVVGIDYTTSDDGKIEFGERSETTKATGQMTNLLAYRFGLPEELEPAARIAARETMEKFGSIEMFEMGSFHD